MISDTPLTFFSSQPIDKWTGRHSFADGEIIFPDPMRACDIAKEAAALVDARGDVGRAVRLADDALRLDYDEAPGRRAEIYRTAGNDGPFRALMLYAIGVILKRRRLWREAGAVYHASAQIDPLLCWHLNDFAWMAATAADPDAHAGPLAIKLAEHACAASGWGYWSFVGTLAVAFARCGDFDRAIAWQRVALQLAPCEKSEKEAARMENFKAGKPWVELEIDPNDEATGFVVDLMRMDPRELLYRANELIEGVARTVQ